MGRIIQCPMCQKPVNYSLENRFRPFCSERCKLVDLGKWLDHEYSIPDKDTTVDENDEQEET
jgi:uncharacterized protein